jgi:hypothetical protein
MRMLIVAVSAPAVERVHAYPPPGKTRCGEREEEDN